MQKTAKNIVHSQSYGFLNRDFQKYFLMQFFAYFYSTWDNHQIPCGLNSRRKSDKINLISIECACWSSTVVSNNYIYNIKYIKQQLLDHSDITIIISTEVMHI